jgi:hypothetical protein
MADETTLEVASIEPFDPASPVIALAPMSVGGQQASAVKVTSIDSGGTSGIDETVMGGYYIVGGQSVNAEGKAVNDKGQLVTSGGKVMTAEQILADQYGQ